MPLLGRDDGRLGTRLVGRVRRQADIDQQLVRLMERALKTLTTAEYIARYGRLDNGVILVLPLRGVTSLPSRAAPGALGYPVGGPHLAFVEDDE